MTITFSNYAFICMPIKHVVPLRSSVQSHVCHCSEEPACSSAGYIQLRVNHQYMNS